MSTKKTTTSVEATETKEVETTYAEKQASAAANAALKAAIQANTELSEREAERAYTMEKQKYMRDRIKNDPVVTRTVSKLYAPYLGKNYSFLYNGILVVVHCDGKAYKYPQFIAEKIDEKLNRISESNTYKEVIDERLDQGETF